jgi:hypothetical protein
VVAADYLIPDTGEFTAACRAALPADGGRDRHLRLEVQVGSYLGEDDIIRLEDVYRRHAEV